MNINLRLAPLLLLPALVQVGCGVVESTPEQVGDVQQAIICITPPASNTTQFFDGNGDVGNVNTATGFNGSAEYVLEIDSVASRPVMHAYVQYGATVLSNCSNMRVHGVIWGWDTTSSCWYILDSGTVTGPNTNCGVAPILSWSISTPQPIKLKFAAVAQLFAFGTSWINTNVVETEFWNY